MQIAVDPRHVPNRGNAGLRTRRGQPEESAVPDALRAALDDLDHGPTSLTVWSRRLPPEVQSALKAWCTDRQPRFEQTRMPHRIDLEEASRGLHGDTRAWLMADLAMLLDQFANATKAPRVRFAFGAIANDSCRKFHADYVCFRLLSTYVGPGTEWLPDHAVDREALAHPPDCPCDANVRIARDPNAVRHAHAGDVLFLRGALHPSGLGAVHRSPSIEGTAHSRLLLVMSTVGA